MSTAHPGPSVMETASWGQSPPGRCIPVLPRHNLSVIMNPQAQDSLHLAARHTCYTGRQGILSVGVAGDTQSAHAGIIRREGRWLCRGTEEKTLHKQKVKKIERWPSLTTATVSCNKIHLLGCDKGGASPELGWGWRGCRREVQS